MRPLTLFRAFALVSVLVSGWSMTLHWGSAVKGPPPQWERQVVGAILLAFITTIALASTGKLGTMRSWIARGLALAAALGAVAIPFALRSGAHDSLFPHLVTGGGWTWLLCGSGLAVSAAAGSLLLRPAPSDKKKRKRR